MACPSFVSRAGCSRKTVSCHLFLGEGIHCLCKDCLGNVMAVFDLKMCGLHDGTGVLAPAPEHVRRELPQPFKQ